MCILKQTAIRHKDGVYAALDMSLEAKVDIRLETDNLDITRFDASADVLTDINAVAGYKASVSKEYSYELPSCSIPVAGLFSVVINSSLVVQADGSLNIEATADLSNNMGASFSIDDGFTTYNTTEASAGLTVDAEGSLRVGPREEVELVLCGIEVFGNTFFDGVSLLEADTSFGLGASGKTEVDKSVTVSDDGITYGDDGELKHLCYFCIEGDIFCYFNGSVGVGDDIQTIVDKIADVDLTYTFADSEHKICDWHLSSGEGYTLEFGFTKCPHYEKVKNVPDVTFSAPIGEINGTIYCSRKESYTVSADGLTQEDDVPTCTLLPIATDKYTTIAGFAVYDGYIYFIESEGGISDYRTWLYRCKEDFTGKELLASSDMNGDRDFVIDNNVVYYNGLAIDLSDLSVTGAEEPKYTVTDNGNVYESGYESGYEIAIYNGTTFFTDRERDLYVVGEDGSKRLLASNAYLDGGLAGDYLYYAEYDWEADREAKLYRVSLSSGEREFIASRIPAGGGGPYFCW